MIAFNVISRIVTTRNPTGDYGKALRAVRSWQPQELPFTGLPAMAGSPFHTTARMLLIRAPRPLDARTLRLSPSAKAGA
jgi:hypothetical protein